MPPATLLALGDVHLGRTPGRLPEGLVGRVGPALGLSACVDEALERGVDAVLFAGDVVQDEEHYLEAFGPLRRQVERLIEADIACFGVAGNHDVLALPRLARELPGFRLLGAGGRWESALLTRGDRPLARLLGWSFPEARVSHSPLRDWPSGWRSAFDDGAPEGLPTLGLLHADLDARGGPYAPVRRTELEGAGPGVTWLLGHVHKPTLDSSSSPALGYLGSVCALHTNETGPHGPWLVTLGEDRTELEHLPLSPVRYESLELDLTDIEDDAGLRIAMAGAVEGLRERVARETPARALVISLTLTGRTHVSRAVRRSALDRLREGLELEGDPELRIANAEDRSRPAVDLAQHAGESSPLALLAERLLELQRSGGEELVAELRRRARRRLEDLAYRGAFEDPDALIDPERLRRRLAAQGAGAFERLLSQRGGATAEEPEEPRA